MPLMQRWKRSEPPRSANFKPKADTMFVFDEAALCRNAVRLYLKGKPTGSLAEGAAASKVVDLAAGCRRLRPVERDMISNAHFQT
jgi:hypothetical protein